jgi:hypothetical protein
LTPGRSIAVDRVHEYGTPFFIEGNLPIESAKPAAPFGRLTIAQDTGSAIVGPARADLYLGAGDEAGRIAGRIKHRGRFSMLVPRDLDLAAVASELPLPVPKPKIAESEGDRPDDKGRESKGKEIAQRDDKGKDDRGKPEPVRAVTVVVAGRHRRRWPPSPMPKTMSSPISKVKDVALDAEKADRKGGRSPRAPAPAHDARPAPLPAPKAFRAEDHDHCARNREVGPQGQGGFRQRGLDRRRQAEVAVAGGEEQDRRDRRPETGRQRQSRRDQIRPNRQADAVIGIEDEDRRNRRQERNRQARPQGQRGARQGIDQGWSDQGWRRPTAAKHTASPKAKVSETDGKKQSGKGKAEPAKAGDDGKSAARPARQAASARRSSGALN